MILLFSTLVMERMDVYLRRYEWAFGDIELGKSQRMFMRRRNLCLGCKEWVFGGDAVGKS